MILPPWKEIKGPLTVSFVTVMILFIAYTSQIFVIWPYLNISTLHTRIFILIPLNLFILLVLINYFLTCKTDPGSVPPNWIPRQQAFIEVKKSTHTPRFCKTCDNYKPPRTHHCSVCKRCVLKMDHHCPWVNNCVGFANYCHFFRFLIYVDIGTIYLFVLLCCRLAQLVRDMRNFGIKPALTESCFLSINLVLLVLVMITVGILTAYHVYCITTNTTTIEGWEKGRSLTIKGMGKIHNVKCPYDQGSYKNLQAVLGKWPILWFIPSTMSGTGFDFPINTRKYYNDEEATINNDKNTFASSTSLNRRSTTHSSAAVTTTTRGFGSEDEYEVEDNDWIVQHDEKQYRQHVEITPLQPLKTKPSTNTIGSIMTPAPATPGSILTFASNTTTLVDYRLPSPAAKSLAQQQDGSDGTPISYP